MHQIIFDGIFIKNNIKHIRFKCNNSVVDIPLDDNLANHILISLQKIAPMQNLYERGNDEPDDVT